MIDAIIPAGGRIDADFAARAGTDIKALIELGGRPILARTIEALRESGCVRRIVVIGAPQVLEAATGADQVLAEGESGPDNIFRGLDWLQAQVAPADNLGRVLIVTGDLPFLSGEVVRDFIDACPPRSAATLGALKRGDFEAKYPNLRGEYVRLRDGEWTIGCAFLLDGAVLLRRRAVVESTFAARKSQWAMARLLGVRFIARWLARRLDTRDLKRRCEQILGCRGHLVAPCAPELAFDLDSIEDYDYARRLLG